MRWRSPREIAFRLRQEARNLVLLTRPPVLPAGSNPRAPFPDAGPVVNALQSTPAAKNIVALADQIVQHRFPLLGLEIDTGPEIHWRRDYVNHKETGTDYFRKIPYLDASIAGDHKLIWELNRHQHLVLLAQAYRLTNRREYLEEIDRELDGWHRANRVQRGINWASALEVAFRALSWTWVDHLVGPSLTRRDQLIQGLYHHALHLEANLSVYFSPNTHLLGEAVALHALGIMFRVERWQRTGATIVSEEMHRQVRADGNHFEQSTYYHVYALDMFLFHAILTPKPDDYRRSLEKMALYLEALTGPSRTLPFIGDDDGGRFFHPYGPRDRFARATLTACGRFLNHPEWIGTEDELATWWLGPAAATSDANPKSSSARFADSGMVVMTTGNTHCMIDAGPFGPFRGGHSHADTLSIVARTNGHDLLIDPGTYSYAGDSPWRNRFRGTAAHNTVRIAGLDQADPAGPFGWKNPPQVEIRQWQSDAAADFLDASCAYRGILHRRRVFFLKPELLFVLDTIEGPHIDAEQFWHLGPAVEQRTPSCFSIGGAGMLILDGDAAELSEAGEFGWKSPAYGRKDPAPFIASHRSGDASILFGAVLAFSTPLDAGNLVVTTVGEVIQMTVSGPWNCAITFPAAGTPRR